ncbi:MAG: hypothetical protein IIZ54_07430, partial [Selenomonadaceae bacterium]|nr:hypothetical protein [Selenomonadaceae bacterium]
NRKGIPAGMPLSKGHRMPSVLYQQSRSKDTGLCYQKCLFDDDFRMASEGVPSNLSYNRKWNLPTIKS